MQYNFEKITEQILFQIDNKYNDLDLSNKSYIFSNILKEYLDSYYFRKKYDNFKIIKIKNDDKFYYRLGYSQLITNSIHDYFGKVSPYLNEINKIENISNKEISEKELTEESLIIIEELKKIDNFNAIVFEKNEIKKDLIMKQKLDIEFEIVENIDINYFSKLIKEVDIKNEDDLKNYLSKNCGLNYLEIEDKGKYFIAKNKDSIAGVSLLVDNPFMYLLDKEKEQIKNRDFYKYLSYVNVGKEFYGLGLSLKLIRKIYEYCENNNYIYERSDPTNDGKKYLTEKILELNNEFKDRLVIINSKDRKRKEQIIYKENLKGNDFEGIKKVLKNEKNIIKLKTS